MKMSARATSLRRARRAGSVLRSSATDRLLRLRVTHSGPMVRALGGLPEWRWRSAPGSSILMVSAPRSRKVRVIVLTGAGRAFCAGGDVKGFAARNADAGASERFNLEARVHGLRQSMEVVRWVAEAPKPTLAVIPGAAAGAGLSLALACDVRVPPADAH